VELGIAQNSSAIANAVVAVVHFRATISTRYVACADMRLKKNELKKVGVLPRTKSGRIHWGKPLIDLKKRTPIKK